MMKPKKYKVAAQWGISFLMAATPLTRAQEASNTLDPYANETETRRDARMAWFREARFGMFIHWGVYAVPAGTYNGKKIDGIGEWIMNRGKIPMVEYRKYASRFNPVKYDPDEWVRLAKEAGMKYIVITSKHHDGFALFDSKVSEWDVVDATPYGKDLIAPLAAACQEHGIKLGLYYSQAQDWNQGGSVMRGQKWDPAQEHDMDDYIKTIAVPQVKEILSNYGPISVLWWDTPQDMTREREEMFLPLLKLQPGIIHNNRLFDKKTGGDIETPEQHIPGTGLPGDWEACMTMNDTWGFKSYDQNWKSTETLIRNLVDIASKGGNYLLNVGPTAEGLIPGPSIERLRQIGAWMKVNSESIHATTASPCNRPAWGRITTKRHDGGTTLYLQVFDWPSDNQLFLPVGSATVSCYLLADTSRVFLTKTDEEGTTVMLTGEAPDPICSVVVLELKGSPDVTAANSIQQNKDGSIELKANQAVIHNVFGSHVKYNSGKKCIENWNSPSVKADWIFTVKTPGSFSAEALLAMQKGCAFSVSIGKTYNKVKMPASGGLDDFKPVDLGKFQIEEPGEYTLTIKPIKQGWHPLNLREVRLTPTGK